MTDLVTWLYGLCFWGASLNFPAWARLLFRDLKPPRAKPWWNDNRFVVRLGLAVLSFGIAGLSGSRFFGAIYENVPIALPSPWAAVFIGLMALAEPFFLRVDEIHARDRGGRSVGWRLYWIGVVTYTLTLLVVRYA